MSKQGFEPVPQSFNFAEAEHEILQFWKEQDIYHKSLRQREGAEPFVFYEGPPTANGMPHPGHCLTRTIKDIFPRFRTMEGYFCERKAGWDTHGLPVEIEVCKELGIIDGGKKAIEEYGIEEFNRACIESVWRYQREWEELTDRIGFWVDLEQAYVTYHQSYVESVWWALNMLFDKGLLYKGHKVVWWWAQGGTALSAGEVGEGYRDTDDPAITVRLALTKESKQELGLEEDVDASLLIWTTTPWTLSSNCAVAVGNDIEYSAVVHKKDDGSDEVLVLATPTIPRYFETEGDVNTIETYQGSELVGLNYEPLFHYANPEPMAGQEEGRAWEVILGDFVDVETGTGLVHLAPAFGEDDYRACSDNGIGFMCVVQPDGTFDDRVTDVDPYDQQPIAGQFCKDADKAIIRVLKERGRLLKHDTYRHPYPFCPRADQDPLIQYARESWFINTSKFIPEFLRNNKLVHWQPEHIRDGRFGNFLENNVDWAISRERYWGTPLPVWVCEKTGNMECVSSYSELMAKPDVQGTEVWEEAKKANPELSDHLRVHKPYIDAVTYQSPFDDSARMRRVTEVIDVWFDAGSMPFAQWGYPHADGSKEMFEDRFPADFISEAIDQTRGWFNALLTTSTMLFGNDHEYPHPFRNCICLGHIMGEDGLKLSKRLKNYKEPKLLFEKFSADALRWSFIAKNPPTSTGRLSERNVEESQRELLIRWYNVYSFFVIYANLDGFDPHEFDAQSLTDVNSFADMNRVKDRSELDRWILNEMYWTVIQVRQAMNAYECNPAARHIYNFVDSLSNWYVRRSRNRFWASDWTQDKADAYWTLYECLLTLSRMAAPFVPFFSEVTWKNLTRPLNEAPESVHLSAYPNAKQDDLDFALLEQMGATREAVTLGLRARRTADIKVRQPLSRAELVVATEREKEGLLRHIDLVKEELNIKEIEFTDKPEEYVSYEVKPDFKVLGPKYGKQVKAIQKALSQGDGADFYNQLQEGALSLDLDGETVELTEEEVEVRLTAKEGFAAAQGRSMVVVIATEITEELRREGWVREFIRLVQDIRKDLELNYDARIDVSVETADTDLSGAIESFREFISGEVLAESLQLTDNLNGATKEAEIEKKPVKIQVKPR